VWGVKGACAGCTRTQVSAYISNEKTLVIVDGIVDSEEVKQSVKKKKKKLLLFV
jgi:isochorismate hydrolase